MSAAETDPFLPPLTIDQADRLRGLVQSALGPEGLSGAVGGDRVVTDQGPVMVLGNLACYLAHEDEHSWPEHVRKAVAVSRESHQDVFAGLDRADVLSRTVTRLAAEPPGSGAPLAYRRRLTTDLSEVLFLDTGDAYVSYLDERVERHGPLDELRRAGLAHLRRALAELPDGAYQRLVVDNTVVHALVDDSLLTASLLLVMPEVLRRFDPPFAPAAGVCVAIPNRHLLLWHVPRDTSVLAAIPILADLAAKYYADGAGQLSAEVHWWYPGGMQTLTERTEDGLRIRVSPELGEVLERITAQPGTA